MGQQHTCCFERLSEVSSLPRASSLPGQSLTVTGYMEEVIFRKHGAYPTVLLPTIYQTHNQPLAPYNSRLLLYVL